VLVNGTESRPVAVITGTSSGIGAATARDLAGRGFHVVLGARRTELVDKLAAELDGTALPLDPTF
jgi:NADP-dependent 3-hydroxy acid dehydrogenase YdfG